MDVITRYYTTLHHYDIKTYVRPWAADEDGLEFMVVSCKHEAVTGIRRSVLPTFAAG
jgi:hypothetical protein